jgi:tryptophanyl-tRNA synthetase
MEEFVVTPWEVKGEVDYEKLIREFGTKQISEGMKKRIQKHTGDLHLLLRRNIFFSHRDFDWILDKYESGEKFFLYTGRGPSGKTHLGHLIPWIFTKYLQQKFGAELYFQMTDDEKFFYNTRLSLNDTLTFSYDNALDVVACGFNPKKTFIFTDTEYIKTLYKIAAEFAKHVTFSTVKAAFGFNSSTNIGLIFFPSIQAAPCFLPSVLKGKNIPCLIPAAIDQSVYWRVTRDVAPKMGFYKPAELHSKFFPSLMKGGKMSASDPESAIFTTDTTKTAKKKIKNAFTGGQPTIEEQRKKGGNPDICPVYQYFCLLFEENDNQLEHIYRNCREGTILCGECKEELSGKVIQFLLKHQEKREKAKDVIEQFILKD